MVYITGDLHGDFSRFSSPAMRRLRKGDTLIVCGDFGFIWNGDKKEEALLKKNRLPALCGAFFGRLSRKFRSFEGIPRHRLEGRPGPGNQR